MSVKQIEALIQFSPEQYIPKLVHDSDKMRVALFCLDKGQRVPEHTSPSEVFFYVVKGSGAIQVGSERRSVKAGSLTVAPANMPHGMESDGKMVILAVIAPRP